MMDTRAYFEAAFSAEGAPLPGDVWRAEFTRDRIPPGVSSVLDVGCGTGLVAQHVAQRCRVCAVEYSAAGAQRTRAAGVACAQATIEAIPFADRSFDLVMANEVLEHLDERLFAKARSELARVARDYILITVPNRDCLPMLRQECPRCRTISVPWGHLRSFGQQDLAGLFAGFRVERCEAFGPWISDWNRGLMWLPTLPRRVRNPLRPGLRCCVCGFQGPPAPEHLTVGWLLRRGWLGWMIGMDWLLARVATKCPRWLFALYGRAAGSQAGSGGA